MTGDFSEYDELHAIPFNAHLSTLSLLNWWEKEAASKDSHKSALAEFVLSKVKLIPQLCGRIDDMSVFQKFPEETALLFSGIFPAATFEKDLKGVVSPFGMDFFYSTPLFNTMAADALSNVMEKCPEDLEEIAKKKLQNGYLCILKMVYGADIEWTSSMEFTFPDPETGTNRHFSMVIDMSFVDCYPIGDKPSLSDADVQELIAQPDNVELWKEKLPADQFEFNGFGIITPVDITETRVASSIKQALLDRDTLIDDEKFLSLRTEFRDLMKLPDLRLSVGAFSSGGDDFLYFGPKDHQVINIIEEFLPRMQFFALYQLDLENPSGVIIEDVAHSKFPEKLKKRLDDLDIRNLVITPLRMEGDIIGVLQLTSGIPNRLNNLSMMPVFDLMPIVATAVQRSADEIENEVQQIIKSRYTSLHKTVEWRFREEAKHIREAKLNGFDELGEDIVFENVFPMYGATDIRNSSVERNHAIQADLSKQLSMAIKIMDLLIERWQLPIYRELKYRLQKDKKRVTKKLISQDEAQIHELLQKEIEPLFKHVKDEYPEMSSSMEPYFEAIDNKFEVLYDKRKDFEESVAKINKAVYRLIEGEEERSQVMFPFYFENYKTDGVEYNIYIGQSLVKDLSFDPLYLRNLRLWQLLVMCKAANVAQSLLPKLKLKLETTHLILVQSAPLSIRFRTDEKKFDVDGAYNVRYEIMKKRVDKALIRNTTERLTQPGKLAIVYSSLKEEEEYVQYLNYLHHLGCIEREIEHLELEELQGVDGLRALRVKIKFDEDLAKFPTFGEEVISQFETTETP